MDWIDLAQDRYQWRALVNTVMNLQFEILTGKFKRVQSVIKKLVSPSEKYQHEGS
jgi:hypothetical protein